MCRNYRCQYWPAASPRFSRSFFSIVERLSIVRCSTPRAFIFSEQWARLFLDICFKLVARSAASWATSWPGWAIVKLVRRAAATIVLEKCMLIDQRSYRKGPIADDGHLWKKEWKKAEPHIIKDEPLYNASHRMLSMLITSWYFTGVPVCTIRQ